MDLEKGFGSTALGFEFSVLGSVFRILRDLGRVLLWLDCLPLPAENESRTYWAFKYIRTIYICNGDPSLHFLHFLPFNKNACGLWIRSDRIYDVELGVGLLRSGVLGQELPSFLLEPNNALQRMQWSITSRPLQVRRAPGQNHIVLSACWHYSYSCHYELFLLLMLLGRHYN